VPYGGDLHQLDAPRPPQLTHAFRQALLLHGVDSSGLGGMTTAAHTEADVEATVAAFAAAVDLLRAEALA
jgi:glutamate-1-semialdehyde 2,1-aminomutase